MLFCLYFIVIRRHDLVKFIGPSVCKYYTMEGAQTAVIEDGVLGLAISDQLYNPAHCVDRCEILIGDEVVDADPEDLKVVQTGDINVI